MKKRHEEASKKEAAVNTARRLTADYRASNLPSKAEFLQHVLAELDGDETLAAIAADMYEFEGYTQPKQHTEVFPESYLAYDIMHNGSMHEKFRKQIEKAENWRDFAIQIVNILKILDYEKGGHFEAFSSKGDELVEEVKRMIVKWKAFKLIINPLFPRTARAIEGSRGFLNTPLDSINTHWRPITLKNRFSHTHILAGSGSGKTVLLEHMIAKDLEEDCCVIVIDSQMQLIPKLAKLDIPLDEITHITPKNNLSLNLFDVGYSDLMNQANGDGIISNTIEKLEFVLSSLVGTELTPTQRNIFQYAIQLVITIPNGNINDFFKIITDDGHLEYKKYIDRLDITTQEFFYGDFGTDSYKRTKASLRDRMRGLLRNPVFRRMFEAEHNTINMFEEMNKRRLILIDTNKDMLGQGSGMFGRLFISMILRAAVQRFPLAENKLLRPVYLYCDEAHEYFDTSLEQILEQARKAKIGLIVAHQTLKQARERRIEETLLENTATKIVSTNGKKTATAMAGYMATDVDTILGVPQYKFALYTRETGTVTVGANLNAISNLPKRKKQAAVKKEMEKRYGIKTKKSSTSSDETSNNGAKNSTETGTEFTPDKPETI